VRINRLTIKNFRGITNMDLQLEGNSTILFGINGAGKSSILHAILTLFSKILYSVAQGRFKNKIDLIETDITHGKSSTELKIHFNIQNKEFVYSRGMERKTKRRFHSQSDLNIISEYFRHELIDNEIASAPIFAHYGVNRSVLEVPLRIRKKHEFEKIMAFERAILIGTDFRTFFEWYRNQEDLENQIKANENRAYEDSQLKSIRRAIYSFMPEFSNLRVQRNPLRMVITKFNLNLEIGQLSDGEKCTLAMVGDLARRLALANPKLENPLEGYGVVLIDEIELHLHPEWQREIVTTLQKTFPKLQFIITTHSPQVLGEVKNMEIFRLEKAEEGFVCNKIKSTYGRDSNYILAALMNTPEKNEEVKKSMERIFDYINDKNFEQAEKYIEEIREIVGNDDPGIVKATILLSRGKNKL
jgi:predicted ATP-binding protein involved in virulence